MPVDFDIRRLPRTNVSRNAPTGPLLRVTPVRFDSSDRVSDAVFIRFRFILIGSTRF